MAGLGAEFCCITYLISGASAESGVGRRGAARMPGRHSGQAQRTNGTGSGGGPCERSAMQSNLLHSLQLAASEQSKARPLQCHGSIVLLCLLLRPTDPSSAHYFFTYFFTTLSSISIPRPGPVGTSK